MNALHRPPRLRKSAPHRLGERWPDRKRYLGDDKPGEASNLPRPSYGAEAAWVLLERKVGALGVDAASID